jgi:hypothetical protein
MELQENELRQDLTALRSDCLGRIVQRVRAADGSSGQDLKLLREV